MRGTAPVVVAALVGIATGTYLFEPYLNPDRPRNKKAVDSADQSTMASALPSSSPAEQPASISSSISQAALLAPGSDSVSSALSAASPQSPSAIANARTLSHLPTTEISKSAHPDDAAKIMDEPLPSSPLIAKKIPVRGDDGGVEVDVQAEPFKESGMGGMFGRVRFW